MPATNHLWREKKRFLLLCWAEVEKSKTAEYFEAASSVIHLGESLCWAFGTSLSQECTTFDLAV